MSLIKYVEDPFYSVQGEGARTGVLSTWLRFFSCNLNCDGFGQENPADRSTYVLPYKTIDTTGITELTQVPLFTYGCDSSHSWSARFKHLVKTATAVELANAIRQTIPGHSFEHKISGQQIDHVFTGGEPMLQQQAIIDIVNVWIDDNDFPRVITIETNGTVPLTDQFIEAVTGWYAYGISIMFSISQKLFNVSGERASKAFKPNVIESYTVLSHRGQLKYVVNNSDAAWEEMLDNIQVLRDTHSVFYPVWIMPVGASYTDQTNSNIIGTIADRAIANGFNVTGRLHVVLWGNDQHGR